MLYVKRPHTPEVANKISWGCVCFRLLEVWPMPFAICPRNISKWAKPLLLKSSNNALFRFFLLADRLSSSRLLKNAATRKINIYSRLPVPQYY